ncbi:MAG: hypothetical protein IJT27_02845 [Clostridia bacterium]|nr:hypothetical protein [Clostridia bacterium]
MKNVLKKGLSVSLCIVILFSLSSCSLIEKIKELKNKELLPTPEASDILPLYNTSLTNALAECENISCSVQFNVYDVNVTSDSENAEIDLLDNAGKQLSTMILANKPGFSDETITADEADKTLLRSFEASDMLELNFDRTMKEEKLLNKWGKEIKDENGEPITEIKAVDNTVKVMFNYYTDTVITEATTDAEGNAVDAVTQREFAESEMIEQFFGEPHDKDAILAEFDSVKDYIQVNDYTFEYTDCKIESNIDMEFKLLQNVSYEKNMLVTASVTGVGSLAQLGDFTVTFNLREENAYSFKFAEAEE